MKVPFCLYQVSGNAVRRVSRSLLLLLLTPFFTSQIAAQSSITPLQEGEYEIREEREFFNPGARFEGYYKAFYSVERDGLLTGDEHDGKLFQDIEVRLISKVNTNLFIHAYFGTKSKVVEEQDAAYNSPDSLESSDSTSDGGMDVVFREAYLEYNHNPNASLRIGKQYINVGDGMGLIYQGRDNAISQQCRIGTWCYYVGGARIGKSGRSSLYWLQLNYPVYESGDIVSDPWVEGELRQKVSFNVELLRVMYRGIHIPMSESGHWVGEFSPNHATVIDSGETKYVYFDNDGVEYIGLNLGWNYNDFLLDFTWLNLAGKRDYFSSNSAGNKVSLGTKRVSGNAYYLNTTYRLHNNWKGQFTLFSATGNDQEGDGTRFWQGHSTAFLEVKKGNYGDALIYFDGRDGLGEGHSVSNLLYYSLAGFYIDDAKDLTIDLTFYSFSRNRPVYTVDDGQYDREVSDIGRELDVVVTWQLEETLHASLLAAIFQKGAAYTKNDNLNPDGAKADFSLLGARVQYTF